MLIRRLVKDWKLCVQNSIKQVDIVISNNQALHMLYLKHPQKFDPYEINKYTLQYKLLLTRQ